MKKKTKRLVHSYAYCLQIGTCQEYYLPATEQQQWYLPSASGETEPGAAAASDLQQPRRNECLDRYFQELIS